MHFGQAVAYYMTYSSVHHDEAHETRVRKRCVERQQAQAMMKIDGSSYLWHGLGKAHFLFVPSRAFQEQPVDVHTVFRALLIRILRNNSRNVKKNEATTVDAG